MRVESCGPLFGEAKEGDIFFPAHRFSEPIKIINPKNDLTFKEEEDGRGRFLELEDVDVGFNGHQRGLAYESSVERLLPVGFFLTEEEWPLFRQPQFELELDPQEQVKMINLSSANSSVEVGEREQWPQNLESRFNSSSHSLIEPNNNDIVVPNNLNVATAHVKEEGWSFHVEAGGYSPSQSSTTTTGPSSLKREGSSTICVKEETSEAESELASSFQKIAPFEDPMYPNLSMPLPFDMHSMSLGGLGAFLRQVPPVDTIASHSEPITSTSYDHSHTHHQHFPLPQLQTHIATATASDLEDAGSHGGGENSQGYFEDWQSQSIFLSSEVDKAKLKWNQSYVSEGNNNNNNYNQDQHYSAPPPFRTVEEGPPASKRAQETDTLVNFLSKFDDKVAAIWGHPQQEGSAIAPLPYSDSFYLSSSSTPVSSIMYPWASPTSEQNFGQQYFDFRSMKNIEEEQQRRMVKSKRAANKISGGGKGGSKSKNYPKEPIQFKPSVANQVDVDPHHTTESFPEEECAIMQSLKEHFGVAPAKEDYFILKTITGVEFSREEKEHSLALLNHTDEISPFQAFVPELAPRLANNVNVPSHKSDRYFSSTSEQEIKAMQESLGGLELATEDEIELDLEVAMVFKGNPKTYIEQPVQVDLFTSWMTHFTPIEQLEKTKGAAYGVTPPSIFALETNIQLPEYRLFDGNEKEYNVYFRPVKTAFPIRFKLRPENDKGSQTEKQYVLPYPSKFFSDLNEGVGQQEMPHHNLDPRGYQWGDNNCDYNFNISNEYGSRTPVENTAGALFDYGPGVEVVSDWFTNGTIVEGGCGSVSDYEYGAGGDGGSETVLLGSQNYLQSVSDYCCDSGIGIDGSSRSGFYEDCYTDYEGEFDFSGGGGTVDDRSSLAVYGQGYASIDNSDADYGQFQGYQFNTWSTSTTSGKTNKNHRRGTKIKPCKYFLMDGTCKRGKNCKFSHDLTTCRYWAEGSCLKGDACPYLHCFFESASFPENGAYKFGGKRYHLESENDFPALGLKNENQMSSSHEQGALEFQHSFTRGSVEGAESAESLVMLADPVGFMYHNPVGVGYAPVPQPPANPNPTFAFPPRIRKKQYAHAHADQPSGSGSRHRGNNKTTGKSQNDNGNGTTSWPKQGNNNNNWISTMISVKEKRKKKKNNN